MVVDDSSTEMPSGLLGVRSRMQFTGRLDVSTSSQQWSLYLYMGRLIWAAGGPHPRRRWLRALTQSCPHIHPQTVNVRATDFNQCQEYHILGILVKRQQITGEQALAVVRSVVAEVLFDIIQQEETKPVRFNADSRDVLDSSLALINAEQMLQEIQQAWNAWCALGLADHSPDLAPGLRRSEQLQQATSERVYKTLVSMVDGQRTLRDLSILLKQDLLQLARLLVPLFRKGLIGLASVPDLPPPGSVHLPAPTPAAPAPPPSPVSSTAPLIACIDDSPRECRLMEQILTDAGYRFLGIQDSIQALPKLLEQKPALIFLDLVMPVANGYEICAQIRRMSLFKETPIVILTSNDGIIDRVRAKVVGSSGFLAKPVVADKVLAVVQKYLLNK